MKLQRNKDRVKFDLTAFRFSVSSVGSYRQCGIKFYNEKVLKLKPEKEATHHRWQGRLVHNAIYQHVADYQVNDGIKSWNLVEEPSTSSELLFDEAWEGSSENKYTQDVIEKEIGTKPANFAKKNKIKSLSVEDPEELEKAWKTVASKMVVNGVNILSNVPQIDKLEYALEFEFMGYPFIGYVDVLAKDADGNYEFYDFKTTWDKPTEDKVNGDMQFILYAFALKKLLNLDYYPTGYLVHLKSGQLIKATITDEIVREEGIKFLNNVADMQDQIFYKSLYHPLCPYCDFYNRCYGSSTSPITDV